MASRWIKLFVTHVEQDHGLLKVWGQSDRTSGSYVDKQIQLFSAQHFRAMTGPRPSAIAIGQLCFARYSDDLYYRARVASHVTENMVKMVFIDYGNSDYIDVSDIRVCVTPEMESVARMTEQAHDYYICNVAAPPGGFTTEIMANIRNSLCYEEYSCEIAADINNKKFVHVLFNDENFAQLLIDRNMVSEVNLELQKNLLLSVSEPRPGKTGLPNFTMHPSGILHSGTEVPGERLVHHTLLQQKLPSQAKPFMNRYNTMPPEAPMVMAQSKLIPAVALPSFPQAMLESFAQQVQQHPPRVVQIKETAPLMYTTERLKPDSYNACVTHVDDGPWSFSIQLQSDEPELNRLMLEIKEAHLVPIGTAVMSGHACVARGVDHPTLCRGVIVRTAHSFLRVFFVDYGNEEELPFKNVFEMPPQLLKTKVLSQKFALCGLDKVKSTEEIKKLFAEVVLNKHMILRVAPSAGNNLQTCELFLNTRNVKEILNEKVREQRMLLTYIPQESPSVGTRVRVVVTWVESPARVFVQLCKYAEDLATLKEELSKRAPRCAEVRPEQLRLGLPCVCQFETDLQWYRAKVTGLTEEAVTVLYVDYGNTDTVESAVLRHPDSGFMSKMKTQAMQCSLDEFNGVQFDEVISNALEERILEQVVEMEVVGEVKGKLVVRLFHNGENVGSALKQPRSTAQPVTQPAPIIQPPSNEWEDSPPRPAEEVNQGGGWRDREEKPRSYVDWRVRRQPHEPHEKASRHRVIKLGKGSWREESTAPRKERDNFASRREDGGGDRRYDRGGREQNGELNSNGDRGGFKRRDDDSDRGGFKPRDGDSERGGFKRRDGDGDRGGYKPRDGDGDRSGFKPRDGNGDRGGFKPRDGDGDRGGFKPRDGDGDRGGFKPRDGDGDRGGFKPRDGDGDRGRFKPRDGDGDRGGFKPRDGDAGGFKRQENTRPSKKPMFKEDIAPAGSVFLEQELEPGCSRNVTVTYYVSPGDLYVQTSEQQSEFKQMMEELQSMYVNKYWMRDLPQVDDLVVARFAADKVLYRAQVVSSSPLTARFVDYGNVDAVDAKGVWALDKRLLVLPKQAVHCSMADVKPLGETWPALGGPLDRFFDQADEFECTFISEADGVHLVRLVSSGRDLATEIMAAGHAQSSAQTKEIYPVELTLLSGRVWKLYVAYVESLTAFFVHINPGHVETIQEQVQSAREKLTAVERDAVTVGLVCISTNDAETWYRARVVEVTDTDVCVSFLDYGDTARVQFDQVLNIPDQLSSYPEQATRCCLDGDCSSVADDVLDKFKEAVEDHEVLLSVRACVDNQLLVAVYNEEGQKAECVKDIGDAPQTIEGIAETPLLSQGTRVTVWHCESPSKVFVNRCEDAAVLEEMASRLAEVYAEGGDPFAADSPSKLCAAKSTADDQWYRARVTLLDEGSATVMYIDYGNGEQLPLDRIKALDPALRCWPVQATQVSLALDCKQANMEAATARLQELLLEKELTAYLAAHESTLVADLVDGEQRVTDVLVREGLATRDMDHFEYLIKRDTKVFISHIDSPAQFWVHGSSTVEHLDKLQEELQQQCQQLADKVTPAEGDLVAALFAADEMWYRGRVLTVNGGQVSVLFIDYGNVSLVDTPVKELPPSLTARQPFATCCALEGVWTADALPRFEEIVSSLKEAVEMEVKNEQDGKLVVDLLLEGQSVAQARSSVQSAAAQSDATAVFLAHVNSPAEFYLHTSEALTTCTIIEEQLSTADTLPLVSLVQEGQLYAVRFPDDGAWYRGKVLDASDPTGTKVLFVDYGNTTVATELRSLDAELSSIPAQAEKCSLVFGASNDVWSDAASQKLQEYVNGEPMQREVVHVLKDTVMVRLCTGDKDITTELESLCEPDGRFEVTILHVNSPSDFYIQNTADSAALDRVTAVLEGSEQFPDVVDKSVGTVCVAKYSEDDGWYRAKILSSQDDDCQVLFIDFGNVSFASELKTLPADLKDITPLAKHCGLDFEANNIPESVKEEFINLTLDENNKFWVRIIRPGNPDTVSIKVNGLLIEQTLLSDMLLTVPPAEPPPADGTDDDKSSKLVVETLSRTVNIDDDLRASSSLLRNETDEEKRGKIRITAASEGSSEGFKSDDDKVNPVNVTDNELSEELDEIETDRETLAENLTEAGPDQDLDHEENLAEGETDRETLADNLTEVEADQDSDHEEETEGETDREILAEDPTEVEADQDSDHEEETEGETDREILAEDPTEVEADQDSDHEEESEGETDRETLAENPTKVGADQDSDHEEETEGETDRETLAENPTKVGADQDSDHDEETEGETDRETLAENPTKVGADQDPDHDEETKGETDRETLAVTLPKAGADQESAHEEDLIEGKTDREILAANLTKVGVDQDSDHEEDLAEIETDRETLAENPTEVGAKGLISSEVVTNGFQGKAQTPKPEQHETKGQYSKVDFEERIVPGSISRGSTPEPGDL